MSPNIRIPKQNKFSLSFNDGRLEQAFRSSYDKSVRIPLRHGIIISILSWFGAVFLIYFIIPEKIDWLAPLTLIYIGSYFGFIVYATYRKNFRGYYHLMGAISNAWAGLYAVFFCAQFPSGENLVLPVLIFIIFFGSYMIRLRWLAGFIAAFLYISVYNVYIVMNPELTIGQVGFSSFVSWMTLAFAIIAGRVAEKNSRIAYTQRRIIAEQNQIIEKEKQVLLQEVHHRVKNNLQIIISLINLELSKLNEEKNAEALRNTQSRVMSMSLVHQRMNQTSDFTKIALSEFVNQQITSSRSFSDQNKFSFEVEIPKAISVDIETSIPLGLILNEILSNFFKHALNSDKGSFLLEAVHSNDECVVTYRDNGQGFPEEILKDHSDTLGIELIHILTEQIDGQFTFFNDNGAVCELKFKPIQSTNDSIKSY